MPRESLDAPENLPKESARQVALGQLEDEVPRMPDQPPTRLEEPLLETREGPALDGDGQDEPTEQIAEVVGDNAEQQPHLVGSEAVTGKAGPVSRGLALLDPLLGRPALVVEADDRRFVPVSVATMKPTRGNNSPRWCSTLAMTRRGRLHEAA
jgi:hypothetical protein